MEKMKIIIVDDHYVVRDGLKILLNNIENIQVIGEASNSIELFKILEYLMPDVIFLDLNMPGLSGIEIIRILKDKFPDIKIIVFSGFTDETNVIEAIEAGAIGVLPKNSSYDELLEAVSNIRDGKEYLSKC